MTDDAVVDVTGMVAVVFATAERAVIFGYLPGDTLARAVRDGTWRHGLVLHRARMCVRWT